MSYRIMSHQTDILFVQISNSSDNICNKTKCMHILCVRVPSVWPLKFERWSGFNSTTSYEYWINILLFFWTFYYEKWKWQWFGQYFQKSCHLNLKYQRLQRTWHFHWQNWLAARFQSQPNGRFDVMVRILDMI